MNLWSLIIKEKRLLRESVFIPIENLTLILKMVEKDVFLVKPKLQYHLSQWREYAYGAQSWKQRRLLLVSVFTPIDWWTLILKHGKKWSFSYETKASIVLCQCAEWIYGA